MNKPPFLTADYESRSWIAHELLITTHPFTSPAVQYDNAYIPSLRFYAKRLLETAEHINELLAAEDE